MKCNRILSIVVFTSELSVFSVVAGLIAEVFHAILHAQCCEQSLVDILSQGRVLYDNIIVQLILDSSELCYYIALIAH